MPTSKEFLAKQEVVNTKQNTLVAGDHISLTPQQNGNCLIDTLDIPNYVELTKAEYDALSEEEKLNGTLYCLTDVNMGEGGYEITDYVTNVRVNNATVVSHGVADIDLTSYATQTWVNTQLTNKQDSLVEGTNITITGATISAQDTTYTNFTGADAYTSGAAGLVPAPPAGSQVKFLRGDGVWSLLPSTSTSDLINYSTLEQDTGINWIDGSNIYQITFDLDDVATQTTSSDIVIEQTVDVEDLNIKSLIDAQCIGYTVIGADDETYNTIISAHHPLTQSFIGLTEDKTELVIKTPITTVSDVSSYEICKYLTIKYLKPEYRNYSWIFDAPEPTVLYDTNEDNLDAYPYGIKFTDSNPAGSTTRVDTDWDETGLEILTMNGGINLERNGYTYIDGSSDWSYFTSQPEKEFERFTIEVDIDEVTGPAETGYHNYLYLVQFNHSGTGFLGLDKNNDYKWVFTPDIENYNVEQLDLATDYFDGSTLKIYVNGGKTYFYKDDVLVYTSNNAATSFYGIGFESSVSSQYINGNLSALCKITGCRFSRISVG